MSETKAIRAALYYQDKTPSKREIRAARTRAEALSPVRIMVRLLTLPLVALSVALSMYVRTSDYDPPEALAHLVARGGCDAARSVGLAVSYRGGLGYHARNDADGNGVACDSAEVLPVAVVENSVITEPVAIQDTFARTRMTGGAKFVKPQVKP
ncbi:MAG: excalibur calcium-binding domain-containing protein [Rhodobacteraceae bacterium]|nr:excalibur calcium-binding domain-containing protein [Paracoccaceae bacterium]